MSKLTINNLLYKYPENSDFILDIESAEYTFGKPLGIYGLSGTGKSTFGKLIAGLIKPESGKIMINENENAEKEQMNIIYSSQFPENIFLGNSIKHTVDSIMKHNQFLVNLEKEIDFFLGEFGVNFSEIYHNNGYELSNGELRRFAISLGFACSPRLLILDEPTIGLDKYGKEQLEKVITQYDEGVILVSHDFTLVKKICNEIWIFDKGNLAYNGKISGVNEKKELQECVGLNYYRDFKSKIKKKQSELKEIN